MPTRALRTLVVGERFPWPEDHGAGMRLANVVEAFSLVGEVDLFAMVHEGEAGACIVPPEAPVVRVATAARPPVLLTRRCRLAWLAAGRVPLELFRRDFGPVRAAFRAWEHGPYDLAWFGDAEAYVALGPLVAATSIVDFDDLEDQAAWLRGQPTGSPWTLAEVERRLRQARNARLWRRLRKRAARSVAALAVCSELDQARVGVPGTVVVPNGYRPPAVPLGRRAVGRPPTVLLPGFLRYLPNIDAATRLVHDIGPILQTRRPDVQIRLVGLGDARTEVLHRPPAVVVTGRVDDMATELGRADVVAVPLRHGGGTRIKILEAFAHRIPVVSTHLGAQGLAVRDGEHLLLRDGDADFASACLSLLEDEDLRSSLVERANALFHERYRWDHLQRRLGDIAAGLVDADRARPLGETR